MLRQPRKSPQTRRFKFRRCLTSIDTFSQNFVGIIKVTTAVKLFWHNFEALRLQLVWTLGRQRKFSKKMFFKHKMGQKKAKTQINFRWKGKSGRVKNKILYLGFPHLAYTLKPKGSRMGKGKGASAGFYYKTRPGQGIILIKGCSLPKLQLALTRASKAIPGAKIKIITFYKKSYPKWN